MQAHDTELVYLDGDEERKTLVRQIQQVRQEVFAHITSLPENTLYEARYNGLTPAAMLAHLNVADNIAMLLIRSAMARLPLPLTAGMIGRINGLTTHLFRRRLVASSIKGAQKNEAHITRFILHLPMDHFTRPVFYWPQERRVNIEQAVQLFFLHYWRERLQQMQQMENLPTARADQDTE